MNTALQHPMPVFLLLAIAWASAAQPADPELDPKGWGGIILGSSFDATVKQLGDRAKSRTQKPGDDTPEKLDYVDASEVDALADRFLRSYRSDRESTPIDIVEASREIKKLLKVRRWKARNRIFYAGIKAVGPFINIKLETRSGQIGNFTDEDFDSPSREIFNAFSLAGSKLLAYETKLKAEEYDSGDIGKIQGPQDLVVSKIEHHGVTLTQKLEFSPTLNEITLTCSENVAVRPAGILAAFEEICDEMEMTLGPSDSAVLDQSGRRRMWAFPTTTVSAAYEKRTIYTEQFFNGQYQMRPSTTEHITISYRLANHSGVTE